MCTWSNTLHPFSKSASSSTLSLLHLPLSRAWPSRELLFVFPVSPEEREREEPSGANQTAEIGGALAILRHIFTSQFQPQVTGSAHLLRLTFRSPRTSPHCNQLKRGRTDGPALPRFTARTTVRISHTTTACQPSILFFLIADNADYSVNHPFILPLLMHRPPTYKLHF